MTVPVVSVGVWTGVGLGLSLAGLALAAVLIRTRRACPPDARPVSALEAVLWCAVVATGAWLRLAHVTTLNGGRLASDEAQATRTYVSSIVSFSPAEFGATYVAHAWLLDGWYALFGVGTYSARYYTAAINIAGLVLFFATLAWLINARVAAWAAALLAVATYAVHFSVFAVEVSVLQFGLPLGAFAFVAWLRRPSVLASIAAGLALGSSLFTYPGVLVGYAAIVGGWALAWTAARLRGQASALPAPAAAVPVRAWLLLAASAALVVATAVVLHHRVYRHIHGLLAGGGSLDLSVAGVRQSLGVVLHDLFIETRTWLEIYRHTPFVDWTYWPFALVGAWCLWTRRDWVSRGIILSVPLVVLIAAVCGAYPGSRRALYILMPVCALAALGVDALYARAGAGLASLAVLLAVGHPVYYQATIGRGMWTEGSFGQSFGGEPIPDALLLETLESHDVVMSADEFSNGWDRNRMAHYWRLALRHGALRNPGHTLAFVSARAPERVAELASAGDAVLVTWTPERVLSAVAKPAGLCFGFTDLERRPALIPLVPPGRATVHDLCPWRDGRETALTRCVRLGHNHPLSRVVHGLFCEGAYCDSSRGETSYVEPGAVSFRLRPPGPGPARLLLQVAVLPPRERENRVTVNGQDVGVLDRSRLDGSRLSIDVPPSAAMDRDFWTVTLGPGGHPGFVGWDVVWAALVPAGEAYGNDTCPVALCVAAGQGQVCEETRSRPPS